MSAGGTLAAMYISLKNNKNLRLHRKKYFDNDVREIKSELDDKKCKPYKHLTEAELTEVKNELREKNKIENLKKVTALIIALVLTAILIYITVTYFDFTSTMRL